MLKALACILSVAFLSGTALASDAFMRPGDHAASARRQARAYPDGGNVRPLAMDSHGIVRPIQTCPLFFPGLLPERQDPEPVCLKPVLGRHDSMEKRLAGTAKAGIALRSARRPLPRAFRKASAPAHSIPRKTVPEAP